MIYILCIVSSLQLLCSTLWVELVLSIFLAQSGLPDCVTWPMSASSQWTSHSVRGWSREAGCMVISFCESISYITFVWFCSETIDHYVKHLSLTTCQQFHLLCVQLSWFSVRWYNSQPSWNSFKINLISL